MEGRILFSEPLTRIFGIVQQAVIDTDPIHYTDSPKFGARSVQFSEFNSAPHTSAPQAFLASGSRTIAMLRQPLRSTFSGRGS